MEPEEITMATCFKIKTNPHFGISNLDEPQPLSEISLNVDKHDENPISIFTVEKDANRQLNTHMKSEITFDQNNCKNDQPLNLEVAADLNSLDFKFGMGDFNRIVVIPTVIEITDEVSICRDKIRDAQNANPVIIQI